MVLIKNEGDGIPFLKYLTEKVPILPLFLFLSLIVLQMLPLPIFIHKFISPGTYHILKKYLDPTPLFFPISVAPIKTLDSFLFLISCLTVFVYSAIFIKGRRLLKGLSILIIVMGSLEALYGIFVYILGNHYVLTLPKVHFLESITGTFINRNHYAGYLEMTIGVTWGMLLYQIYKTIGEGKEIRKGIVINFISEKMGIVYPLIFAFILQIIALIYSKSRMGLLGIFTSFVISFILIIMKGRSRVSYLYIIILFLLPIFYLIGIDPIVERFTYSKDIQDISEGRFLVWMASFKIFSDFPIFGSGLGTFSSILPSYQPLDIEYRFDHAHNDYLQLLVETGIIGAIIFLLFMLLFFRNVILVWKERHDRLPVCLFTGTFVSIVSIGIHSIMDFNLHLPSNALLFSFLMGMTVSLVHHGKGGRNASESVGLTR